MTIHSARPRPVADAVLVRDPGYQAFLLLRTAFALAPIAFGIDKFFNVLTDWEGYLASRSTTSFPAPGTRPCS
jgi:hypothetical protein